MLTELHGCGLRVKCMGCGEMTKREDLQPRMEELNAEWMKAVTAGEVRPDGDVELEEGAHEVGLQKYPRKRSRSWCALELELR
ncbi:hypothetical protein TELCIR_24279 [Teladorsagia circumcincta]|uniref:Uncharacterized protein n=1 Tax=Teladorsagia circumcincta TaxID=45464 RepID=A0A2G9T8R9_TELCI|nr:hypothetical protein TELCIR_24279 [Teladorsagia circumcincta]